MRNRKLLGKRIAATVMAATLTVSLCACGENNKTTDNDKKIQIQQIMKLQLQVKATEQRTKLFM